MSNANVFQERFKELVGDTTTQEEVAKKVNTSRQNVGNWLKGKSRPDIYSLVEIAKGYGVSTDWLLGLSENPSNDPKVQDVYEYTGLTKEAAEKLHDILIGKKPPFLRTVEKRKGCEIERMTGSNKLSADIISSIVEHDDAAKLFINILKYSTKVRKHNEFIKTHDDGNGGVILDGMEYEKAQDLLQKNRKLLDDNGLEIVEIDDLEKVLKWEVSNCFEKIIQDIVEDGKIRI